MHITGVAHKLHVKLITEISDRNALEQTTNVCDEFSNNQYFFVLLTEVLVVVSQVMCTGGTLHQT